MMVATPLNGTMNHPTTREEIMQRITIAAVTAAALSAVLLTGCGDSYECTSTAPVYFNTEDGRYHYENVGGPLANADDVKHGCPADSDGVDAGGVEIDLDGSKVKKTKAPAVKQPNQAPGKAPAAPRSAKRKRK